MTATTVARLNTFQGSTPVRGTLGCAASVLILKGTIVTVDSDGNADVVTASQDAFGIAASTYDNRDGSAGDLLVDVDFGVHRLNYSGTAPEPGQVVYVLDNQTVTIDGSGSKGVAGFCTEMGSGGVCSVFMGPHVSGEIAVAADVEATADDALARTVLLSAVEVPVSLGSFCLAAGTPLPAFSDGVATGFNLADSEGFGIRFNPSGDVALAPIWASAKLPDDLDATATVTLNVRASRIGSSDTTVVITPHVFQANAGTAYDAGSDLVSGNTGAIAGATKVPSNVSKVITGALAGATLSISLQPSAALDADDLLIHAVWITCTRDVIA
jgi:hypothetical protein